MLTTLKAFWMANKSPILFGVGVGGIFTTAGLTGEACVKADHALERLHYESETEPTMKDKAKTALPYFWKPLLSALGTVGAFVGSRRIDHLDLAAVTTLYSLRKDADEKMEEKLKKVVGEKKLQKVKDEIANDDLQANKPSRDRAWQTGDGNTVFRDMIMGGEDFASNIEKIKASFNTIQSQLNNGDYATVGDLLYEQHRPQFQMAQEIGWPPYSQIEPYLSSVDFTKDLQEVREEDLTDAFALFYTKPGLLPDM